MRLEHAFNADTGKFLLVDDYYTDHPIANHLTEWFASSDRRRS